MTSLLAYTIIHDTIIPLLNYISIPNLFCVVTHLFCVVTHLFFNLFFKQRNHQSEGSLLAPGAPSHFRPTRTSFWLTCFFSQYDCNMFRFQCNTLCYYTFAFSFIAGIE